MRVMIKYSWSTGPIFRFSVKRGLKLIMDVESFDYAYFPRGSRGFKVALSDGRDKAVINQEGFYVAPGTQQLINPPRKRLQTGKTN